MFQLCFANVFPLSNFLSETNVKKNSASEDLVRKADVENKSESPAALVNYLLALKIGSLSIVFVFKVGFPENVF